MKGLLKKVRGDKKGFTLAELLVVVAIIAILVAVSIPIFTAQLGKATKATNQANLRAAKAAAVAEYLTNKTTTTNEVTYVYNITDGTVKEGTLSENPKTVTIDHASSTAKYTSIQVTVSSTNTNSVTFKVLPTGQTDDDKASVSSTTPQ